MKVTNSYITGDQRTETCKQGIFKIVKTFSIFWNNWIQLIQPFRSTTLLRNYTFLLFYSHSGFWMLFNLTVSHYFRFSSKRTPPQPVYSREKGHYSRASWTGASLWLNWRVIASAHCKTLQENGLSSSCSPLISLRSGPRLLHASPGVLAVVGATVNYGGGGWGLQFKLSSSSTSEKTSYLPVNLAFGFGNIDAASLTIDKQRRLLQLEIFLLSLSCPCLLMKLMQEGMQSLSYAKFSIIMKYSMISCETATNAPKSRRL